MGKNPHDTPVRLPGQSNVITLSCKSALPHIISCRREIPHVMSGLFGRKLQLGIRGGDFIVFASDDPTLRSYLVLRIGGEKLAISSGNISLNRLAEFSVSELFAFNGEFTLDRTAELRNCGSSFALSGNANLLKGRLRLISEMDDYNISVWDGLSLTDTDFIIEEEET